MQFIFDHMSAFFAMAGVMLIFGLIQIRGSQSASEAVINNMVYSEIVGFSEYLQVDLHNMRTEAQVDEAISNDKYTGGVAYECGITSNGDVTTELKFPTLADPKAGYAASNPEEAEVILVKYELTDSGETITIPKQDSKETVSLYTIERTVDGHSTGGSEKYVTHFLVAFLEKGSDNFNSSSAPCSSNLSKVRFEMKFATRGVEFITNDQQSTSQTNVTRFGATVDLPNMD